MVFHLTSHIRRPHSTEVKHLSSDAWVVWSNPGWPVRRLLSNLSLTFFHVHETSWMIFNAHQLDDFWCTPDSSEQGLRPPHRLARTTYLFYEDSSTTVLVQHSKSMLFAPRPIDLRVLPFTEKASVSCLGSVKWTSEVKKKWTSESVCDQHRRSPAFSVKSQQLRSKGAGAKGMHCHGGTFVKWVFGPRQTMRRCCESRQSLL